MWLLKYSNELSKLPTKAEKVKKKENKKEKNDKRKKKDKGKPPKGNRSVRLILIGHPHD